MSATASKLTGFSYGSLGCFGAGGFQPGHNPYKSASSTQHVGTIAVAKNGSFSVKNRKSKFTFAGKFGGTIITTSQVTGRFAKAKTATGAITFRQRTAPSTASASAAGRER